MKITKEKIISEIGSPILRPIAFIQTCCLITFIISPILWIWLGWALSWKFAATGILGAVILRYVQSIIENIVKESVNEELEKMSKGTKNVSGFKNRLDDMMKEAKKDLEERTHKTGK